MKERTLSLSSVAGKALNVRIWAPEGSSKRSGAVILVHGLGEHCGRYAHVARHFTDRGFSVYGADHVGFGASEGIRGDAPGGLRTLERDVLSVLELASKELGEASRNVLLGHSMGGLVALQCLLHHPEAAREAIVSGPALNVGARISRSRIRLARVMGLLLPVVTTDHGIDADKVCSDPEVVSAYVSDPLVHRRISSRLLVSMIDEGDRVRAARDRFDPALSLLLLHGEEDAISLPGDTRAFADAVACERTTLHVFPRMRHEVFNEPENAKTFQSVDRFLEL
jgi:alpha-beta hydrolase superfamily lysophospholipase